MLKLLPLLFLTTTTWAAPISPLTPCERLVAALKKQQEGKTRSGQFVPMALVTVRDLPGELSADERTEAERLRVSLFTQTFETYEQLPVAFQKLLIKLVANAQTINAPGLIVSKFWYTPPHWYHTAPEVFPPGHRERERPDSRTQVFAGLDEALLKTLNENLDLVEHAELYTLPNKFLRTTSRRDKKRTKSERFLFELANAQGEVFARWKIDGRSSAVFYEELQQLDPPDARWSHWDSSGQTIENEDRLTFENLMEDLDQDALSAWAEWIESAIKIQKLKYKRML